MVQILMDNIQLILKFGVPAYLACSKFFEDVGAHMPFTPGNFP